MSGVSESGERRLEGQQERLETQLIEIRNCVMDATKELAVVSANIRYLEREVTELKQLVHDVPVIRRRIDELEEDLRERRSAAMKRDVMAVGGGSAGIFAVLWAIAEKLIGQP